MKLSPLIHEKLTQKLQTDNYVIEVTQLWEDCLAIRSFNNGYRLAFAGSFQEILDWLDEDV